MKQLFATLAVTALLAAPAAASNWEVVAANGSFSAPSTWSLLSGTDVNADGLPDAGDNVTIPTGMKLWMDQSTDLGDVVVTGDMCGAVNSATPIAYVHKMNSLTVSGNLELADGRAQGTVTYDVNNLTVNSAGGLFCARFAAATKPEQTVPILKIGNNFTMSSGRAFPIYPLNFGGTFYSTTQLEFSGAGAATVNFTIASTVEFGKVTVPAGKSVTFSGAGGGLYVGNGLLTDAPNPFLVKTGGEALFEQSTPATLLFPWGPGYLETEAGAVVGTSHPEGFEGGWQKFTSLAGPPVVSTNTVFKFFGAQTQLLGALLGASVDKVILDKTGGSVNMEKNLTVAKLDLLNGTINTGAFTFTGPNTLADLTQTNGNIVGNWVKPWLASVAGWDKY